MKDGLPRSSTVHITTMKWIVVVQPLMTTMMFFVVDRLQRGVAAFADGAPQSSCDQLSPSHAPYQPQQTPNPYQIRFLDDVVDYRCGDTVRRTLLVTSAKEVVFTLFVCLFLGRITQEKLFNRFSQNTAERWHICANE